LNVLGDLQGRFFGYDVSDKAVSRRYQQQKGIIEISRSRLTEGVQEQYPVVSQEC